MTIPDSVLTNALDVLEPYAAHPGTGALHDPIYALLSGDEDATEAEVAAALGAQLGHPATGTLRKVLAPHIDWPAPTLREILARHEPLPAEQDELAEVDKRLTEATARERIHRDRILELQSHIEQLMRTANGLAAAGAMVAIFGAIGWLVALGWLNIHWIDAPVPKDPTAAAEGRGTVSSGERRVR